VWTREFAVGGEVRCLFVEGSGAFIAEPLMSVSVVIAESFFVYGCAAVKGFLHFVEEG
jgi:hypothetical protein